MSSCSLFMSHDSPPIGPSSIAPAPSPTSSSSSSSLGLLGDLQNSTSCFMLNQQFFNLQSELQSNHNYTTAVWSSQSAYLGGSNDPNASKQDVSVGTESPVGKDLKRILRF
jgi:hypothetical protein